MAKPETNFTFKVYSITLVLGVALGNIVMFLNDRFHKLRYDSNWDNPFADFLFFLLVGVGESLIPLLIFYIVIRSVNQLPVNYKRALIYIAGFLCTLFPYVTLYNMVNEGYHRDNVTIFAICTFVALALSYWLSNSDLTKLLKRTESAS